jgi:protein gp37
MPAVGVASCAEPQPQKIIYNSTYDLFQSHFSLDGLWIVFEAFRESPKIESTLCAERGSQLQAGEIGTISLVGLRWEDDLLHGPGATTVQS